MSVRAEASSAPHEPAREAAKKCGTIRTIAPSSDRCAPCAAAELNKQEWIGKTESCVRKKCGEDEDFQLVIQETPKWVQRDVESHDFVKQGVAR